MSEKVYGPRLTDEELFGQCLQLDWHGLEAVKEAAQARDWAAARGALAAYVRGMPVPEGFFDIP